jgi:hypothetical protein
MAKNRGILLGDDGDLKIEVKRDRDGLITGGLVIGDVTRQNQRTILLAEKGEIKDAPLLGVGIGSFLDSDEPSELLREVRTNMREDGQVITSCGFDNDGNLVIEGGYED